MTWVECIKDVIMDEPEGRIAYIKGKRYDIRRNEDGQVVTTSNELGEYEHIILDDDLDDFFEEHFEFVTRLFVI